RALSAVVAADVKCKRLGVARVLLVVTALIGAGLARQATMSCHAGTADRESNDAAKHRSGQCFLNSIDVN
ncbi:MAG: hypothetical protein Q7U14_03430, partial [Lacisediminimonas sp.]|nr:hypothetical protein [Lacisediminimonas sp.]